MNKATVFIIGAGASTEANLPTSVKLKNQIAELLDLLMDDWGAKLISGDNLILEALRQIIQLPENKDEDFSHFIRAAHHIRDALPQAISIDNFIDTQRDNNKIALCGKLAIVRTILEAEKNSLLYFDNSRHDNKINFNNLEKTWYIQFFKLLTENCDKNELAERLKTITLIIFNYDRCIEHFLYYGFQNYYKISGEQAFVLIKNIKIYHPYGDVGNLPWTKQKEIIDFGKNPSINDLITLSKKIKTFTEGVDPNSSDINKIKEQTGNASRLIFLGFAFHKLNMQLIAPENVENGIKCYATTFGISKSDRGVLNSQMHVLFKERIKINMTELKCSAFFNEYWRSLSF